MELRLFGIIHRAHKDIRIIMLNIDFRANMVIMANQNSEKIIKSIFS